MPITHATIPVAPDQVGETEWAEAHTLPTAGEIGAITTASAVSLLDGYITEASADTAYAAAAHTHDFLTSASAVATFVTTAQLGPYITSASAEAAYGGGGVAWGGITGTLSNQTDLQTALDNARPWTYVILGSDFETTATSNSNVTGLSFTPAASTRYEIEGRFFLQAAATTTGARPGVSWPSGETQNAGWMMSPNNATAFASRFWGNTTTANAAATGVAVANEGIYSQFQGLLVMGASPSGNFQITLASEVSGSAARMMANSFIRYRTY